MTGSAISDPQTVPGARTVKCGIVLPLGSPGSWDAGMVESPAVWKDQHRGIYGMVYTGYAQLHPGRRGYDAVADPQIGLAWSRDLIQWERHPGSPLLGASGIEGAPDERGATGPFLWQESGRYYLFYFGVTARGYERGRKTLNLATSTDLIHWERHRGNPIIEPAGSAWRRDAIWHPNIVKVGTFYYLFFNASGVHQGREEEFIGYATSSDLISWSVDDDHAPLLVGSGVPGAWDSTGRAGDPSLYRHGDRWYMAYYSWDGVHSRDGLAITSAKDFPLGWEPYKNNPVLDIGAPGSVDALHAGKPFIFETARRHYHYYTAVDEQEKREIALALWPGPCRGEDLP
jgi:predicted GH43/DUF377 family glycosyl hydrolase